MRNAIWEYLNLTAEDETDLWNNGIFVFDTNILLDIYRNTPDKREALLKSFSLLNGRVWLPNHIAHEFAINRCHKIFSTADSYSKLSAEGNTFVNACMENLRVKESEESIQKLKKMIQDWLENEKQLNQLVTNLSDDVILKNLLQIFNDKVGEPFTKDELTSIKEDGRSRYLNKIPPGYCDSVKISQQQNDPKDQNDNNAYGDFIIWKQILNFAKKEEKNIVFVTNDVKEDWWYFVDKKMQGPRPELRKEFNEVTNKCFFMYTLNRYMRKFDNNHENESVFSKINNDEIDVNDNQIEFDSDFGIDFTDEYVDERLRDEQSAIFLRKKIFRQKKAINQIYEKYMYDEKKMPIPIMEQLVYMKRSMYRNIEQLNKKINKYNLVNDEPYSFDSDFSENF